MSKVITLIAEFFSIWRFSRFFFIVLLGISVWGLWKFYFQKNSDAVNYVTARVERADIQNLVTATGILQPREYVDVGAQVSGQLKKLYVDIGSQVKAGDLLAEIDATVYRAKVDGIRAQLDTLKAQLGDKEAQLTLAKIRLEQQQLLMKENATSNDSLKLADATYLSAQALLKALQAQIQQTEFSLRVEEANLTYAKIYAPMTGTVVSITSRQGQTLNANQQAPTIMRIADLTIMTVQTQVSEADIGKLRLGMPVYFTTLGGKDYRWYSKLDRIEPTPQVTNSVVLYNALFDVPNDNHVLMTQMSTQVFFIAASEKDTLVIPASAINFKPRKTGGDANFKEGERDSAQGRTEKSDSFKEKPTATHKNIGSSSAEENALVVGEQYKKDSHRQAPPLATDEIKPQAATVQVMDKNGNLVERKVMLGISNRVQVQVLEGLDEDEKIVSGMKQIEKSTVPTSSMAPNAQGAAGARQMR